MYGRNLKAYRRTNVEAELAVASPHRVIQMLYDGLLERLAQVKGAIARHELDQKAIFISKAVGILNGLQLSLDRRQNPELADRLNALYAYMIERLNEVTVSLDVDKIDEVIRLVLPVKQAWDQIPEQLRDRRPPGDGAG